MEVYFLVSDFHFIDKIDKNGLKIRADHRFLNSIVFNSRKIEEKKGDEEVELLIPISNLLYKELFYHENIVSSLITLDMFDLRETPYRESLISFVRKNTSDLWELLEKEIDEVQTKKDDEDEKDGESFSVSAENSFLEQYLDITPHNALFHNYKNPLKKIQWEALDTSNLEILRTREIVLSLGKDALEFINCYEFCDIILKKVSLFGVDKMKISKALFLLYLEELHLLSKVKRNDRFIFNENEMKNIMSCFAKDEIYYDPIPSWVVPFGEKESMGSINLESRDSDETRTLNLYKIPSVKIPILEGIPPYYFPKNTKEINSKKYIIGGFLKKYEGKVMINDNIIKIDNFGDEEKNEEEGEKEEGENDMEKDEEDGGKEGGNEGEKKIRGNIVGSSCRYFHQSGSLNGSTLDSVGDIDIRLDYKNSPDEVSDEDFEKWIMNFCLQFQDMKTHNYKSLKTEKIEGKKGYKYHISYNKIKFEIFRASFGSISDYHVPTVRINLDQNGFLMFPSYIIAILTGYCIDIRGFYSKKNPYHVIYKHIKNGYTFFLHEEEYQEARIQFKDILMEYTANILEEYRKKFQLPGHFGTPFRRETVKKAISHSTPAQVSVIQEILDQILKTEYNLF